MTLTVLLVPHLDAGDRTKWTEHQDTRPLSPLGRQQAEAVAEALSSEPLIALYSSPALRCRQSLGPLGARTGLSAQIAEALREIPSGESPVQLAARGRAALQSIIDTHPEGSVAVCSHGDIIPALVQLVAADEELPRPPLLKERGEWYELTLTSGRYAIKRYPAPTGFPR